VAPIDERLYDQLVAYLAAKAGVREDFGAGILFLHEVEGRPLDPPLRLHVTMESFGALVRDSESEAAAQYPEIAPVEAAWRQFTDRLWAAVEKAQPGETELVVEGHDVVPQRPD
jgi:hypothetical protein